MTAQISFETYRGDAAENYQRYFVPAIGAPLAYELVERAALRPGERVVDVACGTGVVTRLAAERVGPAGTVVGVDFNPAMLAVASDADGAGAIEWHEANADALRLPDESFEVVLCQLGLQFFADRAKALREMRRVLVPGGRALVSVPGPAPRLFAVADEAVARHLGPDASVFLHTVFSLHEPDELRSLLVDAAFVDVDARSEAKTLRLSPPRDFLWQYAYGTPLAAAAKALDDDTRAAFEQEVVARWQPFVEDGRLILEMGMTTARGVRPSR
jgi:SAM-dependent methyltransferase